MLTTHALRLAALVGRAWIGLVVFDLARLAGFARMHEWIRTCAVANGHRLRTTSDDVVWAVEEACVWYVKRAACLQRSAIATWLLRRQGFHAELVIGFRPVPFESHAWVEIDGQVVNDRPQYQNVFTVLERL
jgi:hypothetical protein